MITIVRAALVLASALAADVQVIADNANWVEVKLGATCTPTCPTAPGDCTALMNQYINCVCGGTRNACGQFTGGNMCTTYGNICGANNQDSSTLLGIATSGCTFAGSPSCTAIDVGGLLHMALGTLLMVIVLPILCCCCCIGVGIYFMCCYNPSRPQPPPQQPVLFVQGTPMQKPGMEMAQVGTPVQVAPGTPGVVVASPVQAVPVAQVVR